MHCCLLQGNIKSKTERGKDKCIFYPHEKFRDFFSVYSNLAMNRNNLYTILTPLTELIRSRGQFQGCRRQSHLTSRSLNLNSFGISTL